MLLLFIPQTLPWAPPLCPPPAAQPLDCHKATPTPRLLSASSACRSSFGSTWPPPTTWCTTPPLTWARHPLCPTWAWTSTCHHRWALCPVNPTIRPSRRPSRCGTARYCRRRRAPCLEASTARPPALRTSVWERSSTQPRWDWTHCQTEDQTTQCSCSLFSQGCTYESWVLSTWGYSTFFLLSHHCPQTCIWPKRSNSL